MAPTNWEQQRVRIYEDLSGLIKGKVLAEPVLLELFARDASVFRVCPLVVVRPQSASDVSACLQYCSENRIPVHARGAGTGLAGESLGPGVVIDFSAYLRRILAIEDQGKRVRLQPGVVVERVQRQLRMFGRMLAPEPTGASVTTLGGSLARCAWASRSLKFGRIGDFVREITVCLADGTRLSFGRESVAEHARAPSVATKSRIVTQVAQLLQKAEQNGSLSASLERGGFRFRGILENGFVNMPRLFAGSEGTLALVVEMTLETVPIPPAQAVALLLFEQLEAAFEVAATLLSFRPTVCDLMDRRHLGLAREADLRFERLIPENVEAAVLVEIEGYDSDHALRELQTALDHVRRSAGSVFASKVTTQKEEIDLLEKIAHVPQPMPQAGPRKVVTLHLADDVTFPVDRLGSAVSGLQGVFREHGVPAAFYCHVGLGQVYVQPLISVQEIPSLARLKSLCDDAYNFAQDFGGSFGLGRGCGLSRSAYLSRLWGADYSLLSDLKKTFDPLGILNPGKIVADPNSQFWWEALAPLDTIVGVMGLRESANPVLIPGGSIAANGSGLLPGELPEETVPQQSQSERTGLNEPSDTGPANPRLDQKATSGEKSSDEVLKGGEERSGFSDGGDFPPDVLASQLDWHPQNLAVAVSQCSACGHCRTQAVAYRMCPLFRAHPVEEASPRAKATIIRAVLEGSLPLKTVTEEVFRGVADLCVHCHMCRIECPARVDIPYLMQEAKAAHSAAHGMHFSDWFLNRLETVAAWGSPLSPVLNKLLGNRQFRWLLEKVFGIAHARKLPLLRHTSFLRVAMRKRRHRPVTGDGPKVVYFVDVYANWFDPSLAEAFLMVLEHNGVQVYVPAEQRGAGTAAIVSGDLDCARRLARRNVMILSEAVRQGHEVVTTEPAAALTLIREYPQILEEEDARLVAAHTFEACDYLWRLHEQGRLKTDFQPLPFSATYHLPCRLRALNPGKPGLRLLHLIPQLTVEEGPEGCSGMAGTYGLKQPNYRSSLRVGWQLINTLRDSPAQAGVTECSTCRIQMEQGTTKPTLHPIKILAAAYGLRPAADGNARSNLLRPSGELTLANV